MTPGARTVFLGSGGFAVPILEALTTSPSVDVVGIVTAPARPVGRRQVPTPTLVAGWADAHGLTVAAPERLRTSEGVAAIAAYRPELLVLADYGRIVPQSILDLAPSGALNVHPSLLPRHRGAAPIPAAILAGDAMTGVTVMQMDAGLDTGPIVAVRAFPLRGDEEAPHLETQLAAEGAALLVQILPDWLAGRLAPIAQASDGVTLTRPLKREDGRLDPVRPAADLERQVRALKPWPGTFIDTDAGRVAVLAARAAPASAGDVTPGRLVGIVDGGLAIVTVDGRLALLHVQPAGGRPMSGAELVRGRPHLLGSDVRAADLGKGR
ncbi:MAG: methionyl-tRNA formyltransferase [Candidatus Limnocylindrales bacterium]